MARLAPEESFELLKTRTAEAIGEQFPVKGKKHTLSIDNIIVTDNKSIQDVTSQKSAKMNGRTWGVPIHGEITLTDNETGRVVDKQRVKLATLPKITSRYSHIVDGAEYQVDNLWRLRPGIYSRVKANGELESQFNIKGRGFHVKFDPKDRTFKVRHGGAQPPLYPIMKALGVDDDALQKAWGKQILEANKVSDVEKKAVEFANRLDPKAKVKNFSEASELIREKFNDSVLDPVVTQRTLGQKFDRISPKAVLKTSERLLGIARGKEQPDDRDALMFKELLSVEDFVGDRIREQSQTIHRKIGNNIDRRSAVRDIITPDTFNRPVAGFFTKTSLANPPEQTNPLEMISGQQKTTILGEEGGIKSAHRITEEAKLVNPSHMGYLDPLHTPEGEKTGVALHLSLGARKKGRNLYTTLYDVKKGKYVETDPAVAFDSVVALPDEVDWKGGKPVIPPSVKASLQGNILGTAKRSDIQFVMPSPSQVFTLGTNLVPFLPSNSSNRATMAGRQMEQAIPLKYREIPQVQALAAGKTSFDRLVGAFASHESPVNGVVSKVTKDDITIKGEDGKSHKIPIYDNYPLNDKKGMIHSSPLVGVGDKVVKEQPIADTNFTKRGVYAPGVNMTVAYLPFRGYNFEDGVVISESAANKLTSEHMYKKRLSSREGQLMGANKYKAYFPDRLTKNQAAKLDSDGVVRIGQTVNPGDTIIAAMAEQALTTEQQKLKMVHKSLVKPFKDKAITWDADNPGEVVAVTKRGGGVEVHVRTEEPAEVGDKIVSRHANKGIITSILPDYEMPKRPDGRHIEVLHNPLGVPGRINLGQVLETAAAKVAEKTGIPYLIKNFAENDYRSKVESDLKKHGLSDREDLTDPHTGRTIPQVFVGNQYTLKLKHQVGKKMTSRSRDAYDRNLTPKGGGPHGAQSLGALGVYAMLAHGAKHNLREAQTWKSDKSQGGDNDDLWTALQAGEMLPPPKAPFAYKKFEAYLKGMGINVQKDGNSLNLMPLTDKQVLEMSNGEIKDGGRMVKLKTLDPEKNGLFDPTVTGGNGGTKWGHIKLKEPMPNPVFQKAIMSITKIRGPEFEGIIQGTRGVTKTGEVVGPDDANATYGPAAVKDLLVGINVQAELKNEEARVGKLKGQNLNETNRRIKYLRALDKLGMKPTEAYMMKNVPVIPPVMRPLSVMDDGSIQFDDVNQIYKHTAIVNSKLGEMSKLAPEEEKAALRADLYDNLRALTGVGGGLNRQYPGILHTIAGTSPKLGFAQANLIKRRQDLTMRSTIIPEPSLSLDEVGVPRVAAMELYKPFVVRELRSLAGMSPLQAQKAIKEDKDIAHRALERVVDDRPLLVKRDPVLHKYGIQAFKPKLISGKAIKIHPLVTSGYNADFDGDQMINAVVAYLPRSVYNSDCNRWSTREITVTARFREKVGVVGADGVFVVCDLSEFPHERQKRTKGHIDFHPVPDGVKVVALDEAGGPVLADVAGWSFHRSRKVEIVTLGSGRQIVTDDDERAVYGVDASSLEWCRRRPSEAEDQFVPVMGDLCYERDVRKTVPLPNDRSGRLEKSARLDFEFGYFLGALVGDGWVGMSDGVPKSVNLGSSVDEVTDRWKMSCFSVFKELPTFSEEWLTEGKLGASDGSGRVTVTCAALARFVRGTIGHGAKRKHLPPFFHSAGSEFHKGLLSGMWDTDGSISWSNAKSKPQLVCNYGSTSLRLVQELQHLLRMKGVTSTITPSETPAGEPFWLLGLSIVELYKWGAAVGLNLSHPAKAQALDAFLDGDPPDQRMAYSRNRLVPLPSALAKDLRRLFPNADHHSIYVTLTKAQKRQYISKSLAIDLIGMIEAGGLRCNHPLFSKWESLVKMDGVHFERVKNIEVTDIEEDGYDLTVPGYETFMSADGIVLSNTMAAFVPISPQAVEEARRMMPSRLLFSPATGNVMYAPEKEAQVGLYMATEAGKRTAKSYVDLKEADRAFNSGDLNMTDVVTIGGVRTTFGRAKVNEALPKQLQGGPVLTNLKFEFDKGEQNKLFSEMAKVDKNGYAENVNKLKDLGNEAAYLQGFSFGLSDFKPHKDVRDPILRDAAKKTATLDLTKPSNVDKFANIYENAMTKLEKALKLRRDDPKYATNLTKLDKASKIKGRGLLQITGSPVLFVDASGKVVTSPVNRSYSEGLKVADYWANVSGGRKGIVQKVQSVREPGYLSKLMVNSTMNQVVTNDDCNTDRGINLSLDEPDVIGRFTVAPVKIGRDTVPTGTLVTPDIVDRLRNAKVSKVVVRSPMRCNEPKGICSKCYGLNEEGHLCDPGTNVGVLAAQAVGERGTQLAMKSFHSGGIYEGREAAEKSLVAGGLDRAVTLLELPKKVKGSAVLATTSGKITGVKKDPAGGFNVTVSGTQHYTPADRRILSKVRPGAQVRKGDPLTAGPINPHEMLPLTGINRVQGHLASELHSIYGPEGIRRRNSEVVVRAMSNVTKIEDPGDSKDLVRGDFAPTSVVQHWNKTDLKGKRPILHEPIMRGVKQVPLDVQEDWLARLNHEKIKETVVEAAQRGWSSKLHGEHPIPPLIYAAEFGLGTEEEPWLY